MKRKTMKITGIILTFVMLVTMLGAFSLMASAADGDACTSTADCTGTYANGFCTVCGGYEEPTLNAGGYYEIGNAGNLYWFAVQVNGGNTAINGELTANIVVNEGTMTADNTGARAWTPIGARGNEYVGTFDGADFTVSGLSINGSAHYQGFFGYVGTGGTVKNVGVINSYIKGGDNVGGVVACNNGTVSDCHNTGTTVIGIDYVGGVVGDNDSTVQSCSNTGTVSGSSHVGGITGYNGEACIVENCCNEGDVIGSGDGVGGAVGQNRGTVQNCHNTAKVSGGGYVGGVVGYNTVLSTVQSSYNTGDISDGEYYVGGVVGYNGKTVENCYNTGSVSGARSVGGVVGINAEASSVQNCYNVGSVSATGENVGGVIGKRELSTVTNCYYLDTCGATGIGASKTSEQFESGAVAILLGDAFGQSLDNGETVDVLPVFATETNKVYQHTNCDGVTVFYGNNEKITEHQAGVVAASSFNTNGKCKTCGTQAVASLTTADATPVVTYYVTLENAIAAAQSADGSTIRLLKHSPTLSSNINSGNFTIDLNGKTLSSSIKIYGGNITLFDDNADQSLITGAITVNAGTLTIDGGEYWNEVQAIASGNLIIENGRFDKVRLNGGTMTVKGGKFDELIVSKGAGTLATVIPNDYYIYAGNGDIVDAGAVSSVDNARYEVFDVTVKKGADLSKDAVITENHVIYNGAEQAPVVTVTVGGVKLVQGTDFKIEHPSTYDFIDAGNYAIVVEGIGNYTGAVNLTYIIKKETLQKSDITLGNLTPTFNFAAQNVTVNLPTGLDEQYVTVKYYQDGDQLMEAPKYAGDYEVHVQISGSPNHNDANFIYDMNISPIILTVGQIEVDDVIYNGGEQKPMVIIDLEGLPFDAAAYGGILKYTDNIVVGTANVTVEGNFIGSANFEIKPATPTITVSAPLDKVMPGYVMDITGVTDAIDNFINSTTFTVVDGEGYSVSGNTITIDEGVKIGSTITVKMTSSATKNYTAGEGTLTLTVGVPLVDTTELEEGIKDLQKRIDANDDDITGITESINNINTTINNLQITADALGKTDADLQKQITDAIKKAEDELAEVVAAIEQKLNDAVTDLQGKISANDTDIDILNAHITRIDGFIETLKAVDETLRTKDTELEGKISAAQTSLQNAIAQIQANLDNAKTELDEAIADLDTAMKQGDADLSTEIANLNTALTNAKAALEKADANNKAELVKKIEDADKALDNAIKAVQKNLDDAKAALDKAISDGDTALDGKIAALNEALTTAKAALEAADTANKSELTTKIDEAYASLNAAVKAVQKNLDDLKAALEVKDNELANKDAELENKYSELQTFIIIVSVVSGIALCGSGAFVVWFFIDKKKRI